MSKICVLDLNGLVAVTPEVAGKIVALLGDGEWVERDYAAPGTVYKRSTDGTGVRAAFYEKSVFMAKLQLGE